MEGTRITQRKYIEAEQDSVERRRKGEVMEYGKMKVRNSRMKVSARKQENRRTS